MKSFKEYHDGLDAKQAEADIDEFAGAENIEVLFEGGRSKAWVTAGSLFLYAKVNSLSSKIANEKDVSKKLDLIADQNKWMAAFVSLAIAATVGDKSAYKKGK